MLRKRLDLIVAFITLLIIFEMMVYVATTPRPQEQFFQLYVLGANRIAEDYYPNGDPDIRMGETVRWYVGVTNSMRKLQLAEVRVKLGNQTIMPPNDNQTQPSPAPLITEFRRFIQNNETWEIPFAWRILNATAVEGSTRILELRINDETYRLLGSSARDGYSFRFIFELWTWQVESSGFQYGWWAGAERRVAWLQIWFNMTRPMGRAQMLLRQIPGTMAKAYSGHEYGTTPIQLSVNICSPIALPLIALEVYIHDSGLPYKPCVSQLAHAYR